ncbi:hypothetical protein GDO81_022993 [Engystomops pustulosus]|uniref:Uncharacterized protein n=1 Tax=Engystomops pustulosus TaxID=76066 RepID=A0AAV6ZP16_ENGPU|nr:hypothetical protein GDO81_022993 [Engystomops pustulosus]
MSLQRMSNVFSLYCWILLLCFMKYISGCGSTTSLTLDEGEDVVLRVNRTQTLSYVVWEFKNHIIAVTRPGQKLELGQYSYKYPGRLFSISDGSLVIAQLRVEDVRVYRAELYDSKRFLCIQLYDLRIDERPGISPSVVPEEACSPTIQLLQLSSRLGQDVILNLARRSSVVRVTWDINNIDHIAITQPGGVMYRQSSSYLGRVSAMDDGSLRFINLTSKDQNDYKAELFTSQWGHLCTQHYQVRLKRSSENPPSISDLQTVIRLGLSVTILLAALSILIHHCKTEIF